MTRCRLQIRLRSSTTLTSVWCSTVAFLPRRGLRPLWAWLRGSACATTLRTPSLPAVGVCVAHCCSECVMIFIAKTTVFRSRGPPPVNVWRHVQVEGFFFIRLFILNYPDVIYFSARRGYDRKGWRRGGGRGIRGSCSSPRYCVTKQGQHRRGLRPTPRMD